MPWDGKLPPELAGLTYRDLHPTIIKDAAKGLWTILDFMDSVPWMRGGADWTAWRACVAAMFGLPLRPIELEIYRQCTGRYYAPTSPAREVFLIVGRRGRKSAIMALLAAYVGAFRDHTLYLAPGEYARIPVLSHRMDDAKQIKGYVEAIFSAPSLSWLVEHVTDTEIRLSTKCKIEIRAATVTAGRGPSSPLGLLDEIAFFRDERSAHPDKEIANGIKGSFANVPDPKMLVGGSSPYARRGLLYEMYRDHYGKEGDPIFVWQAPTLRMHRSVVIETFVAEEIAKDPVSAAAEYGANFRTDVEAFVTEELIDRVIERGVEEIPPADEQAGIQYVAGIDASGGRSDSFTAAIAHQEGEMTVLDSVLEIRAPFDPEVALVLVKALLARYRVKVVEGDNYAGEWVASAFTRSGIGYQKSERNRSQMYIEMLPLLTIDKRCRLLDVPALRQQLLGLDRRVLAGGREVVDHGSGGHDDVSNAVALACVRASKLRLPARPNTAPKNPLEARQERIRRTIMARIQGGDEDQDRSPVY